MTITFLVLAIIGQFLVFVARDSTDCRQDKLILLMGTYGAIGSIVFTALALATVVLFGG